MSKSVAKPKPIHANDRPTAHRPGGRSARVVEQVFVATSAELIEHGYVDLSLERIAARAAVNKTTVYRRWPTKEDLVIALVQSLGDSSIEAPDSGSVREDLLLLARSMKKRLVQYHGRGLARVIAAEHENKEVAKVALTIRRKMREPWGNALRAALARKQIRTDVDIELLVEVVVSSITFRVIKRDKSVDDRFLESLIDLVVLGAKPRRE
jgi:AcrR family transcriptional regulator